MNECDASPSYEKDYMMVQFLDRKGTFYFAFLPDRKSELSFEDIEDFIYEAVYAMCEEKPKKENFKLKLYK